MHVIALDRGDGKYVLLFDNHPMTPHLLCKQLAEWARDDELGFDWMDAKAIIKRVLGI